MYLHFCFSLNHSGISEQSRKAGLVKNIKKKGEVKKTDPKVLATGKKKTLRFADEISVEKVQDSINGKPLAATNKRGLKRKPPLKTHVEGEKLTPNTSNIVVSLLDTELQNIQDGEDNASSVGEDEGRKKPKTKKLPNG